MAWARLDDGAWRSGKLLSVSMPARWVYFAAISWSAEQLTDGAVPARMAWRLAAEDESCRPSDWIAELVAAGLWDQLPDGAYSIHDYLDYNPSKVQILELRAENERRRVEFQEHQKTAGEARAASSPRRERGRFSPAGVSAGESTSRRTSRNDQPAGDSAGENDQPATSLPTSHFPFPLPEPSCPTSQATTSRVIHKPSTSDPPLTPPDRAQDSSPRAGARARTDPDRPRSAQRHESHPASRAGPALTDEECERLDELRKQIQVSVQLAPHADAVDRVLVSHLRQGAPFGAIERGLASVLEHQPRDPAAYLAKVLRVEVPNHHEAAAIASHQALKDTEARTRCGPTVAVGQDGLEKIDGPLATVLGRIAAKAKRKEAPR